MPVAKRESHRLALRAAATSGDHRFFLGTDSAPHVDPLKECACGCAGIYTSVNTMSCLAMFSSRIMLWKSGSLRIAEWSAWYGCSRTKKRSRLRIRTCRSSFLQNAIPAPLQSPCSIPFFQIFWNVVD